MGESISLADAEKLQEFVTGDDLNLVDDIAEKMEGFTGADLEDLIQESVDQLRRSDQDTLTVEFIGDVLEGGGFGEDRDFEEREIKREEIVQGRHKSIKTDRGLDYIARHSSVYMLENDDAKEIAVQHFKRVRESIDLDRDVKFKFRTIGPRDLLDSDSMRARENTVQAFHHREKERICLYLRDTEMFFQGRNNSVLINRLIGIINEELLQWNSENLLIIDPIPEGMMDVLPKIE